MFQEGDWSRDVVALTSFSKIRDKKYTFEYANESVRVSSVGLCWREEGREEVRMQWVEE